jgi:hypothetical protein
MKIINQFNIEGRGLVFECHLEPGDPEKIKRGDYILTGLGLWEILDIERISQDVTVREKFAFLIQKSERPIGEVLDWNDDVQIVSATYAKDQVKNVKSL